MSRYVIAALLLLVALGSAAGYVHHRGYLAGVAATQAAADKRVKTADTATTEARSERDAAQTSLARVQDALAEQKARLERAAAVADAAMADRNRIQHVLDRTAVERKTALKETVHAQADCAALGRDPVCPAVAERLWGDARQAGRSD